MNELTKFLIKELLDEPTTVAIYGGGFKPPTKGHFNVAKQTLEQFPKIDELKIFVGGGVRDGITQDESIQVWNIYKNYLSDKVSIEPSVAPVKSVLGYAKENPDTKVYWILGAREGEESDLTDIASRTKSISKYPNLEVKVITSKGGVSGTKTRQALKAGNKEQFFHLIPDVKEKEQIWNIVHPAVKEEITPDQIKQADAFADKQLAPIDVDLTSKHVFDRLTGRDSDVTLAQLIGFFKRLGQNKKEFFDFFKKYKEIVATDKRTDLNIPFLNMTNKAIAKTIMRKDNFLSSSPKLVFEVGKEPTPDDITRILKRTGDEQDLYVKDWDEFTPELCNDGFCDIFAEKFREEYPGAELWQTSASTSPWGFGHSWVKYKDKFYDAETPNGVKDWKDLPYIQRLYQIGKKYPEDVKQINEVGEANLKPYKWEEVDAEGYYVYVHFVTDSETQYDVDIKSTMYFPPGQMDSVPALEIEFLAKPKDAQGSSAKVVVNKGELYRVMATLADIIKKYLKKSKAQAIIYSPSKKSSEENFGTQRDNLYRAFISKAFPGTTFKKSGDDVTAILPNNMINEGRYDSITRLVVKDIMDSWKSQFEGKEGELRFEEDYELENSKGQPIDFELLAVLKLEETEDKTYIVDGGANEELDPPYLEVTFQVDPRSLPKMWSTIYNDLIDVVRHEIEHLTQSGTNVISSKEMADDQSIRQMINWGLLPQAEYFKLEKEVDAMLQGMYLKAKKSKTPFKDVINNYFEKVGLEGEDKQDVLDLWTKRLKALSLPSIQEAAKRIPQKTKSGKKLPASKHSDLYTDEDPKGTITGLGFKDASTAREGVSKINKANTTHAHKVQATLVMKQRAKVAIERTKDPEKKKNLQAAYRIWSDKLEQLKRKTKSMKKEATDPQAGTALPYGSGFGPVKELVTATQVICDNCGWEWDKADGGKDLYICHKCGHDNTPKKEDPFGLNELAKTFVKEVFEKDWNLQDGMLSLTKYMMDNGMNIRPLPKIKVIKDDKENASNLLGKTAYYNPADKSITLYTMNRHPKDVLRSFSHEMVHHMQNLEGRLSNINTTNTNEDGDLPEIEREAYEKGNMMLRNWEDNIKNV